MVVTDRTMRLVHESHGFDHYLLKTPACDLKSELALQLKRQMLQALQDGSASAEVMREYGRYLEQYSSEEIEWYGLTFAEAIAKVKRQLQEQERTVPLKMELRSRLLEQLRQAGVKEAQAVGDVVAAKETTTAADVAQSVNRTRQLVVSHYMLIYTCFLCLGNRGSQK